MSESGDDLCAGDAANEGADFFEVSNQKEMTSAKLKRYLRSFQRDFGAQLLVGVTAGFIQASWGFGRAPSLIAFLSPATLSNHAIS